MKGSMLYANMNSIEPKNCLLTQDNHT